MPKPSVILLFPLLLLVGIVRAALTTRGKSKGDALDAPWPLEAKRYLLSERERALFDRLKQSLPEHIVMTQVQLLQAVQFRWGQRSQALLNRISQLSIDFLILNTDTRIVAAIELDDATHTGDRRAAADARKTRALKSAGIPLIRWNARSLPDSAAIRAAVLGEPPDVSVPP